MPRSVAFYSLHHFCLLLAFWRGSFFFFLRGGGSCYYRKTCRMRQRKGQSIPVISACTWAYLKDSRKYRFPLLFFSRFSFCCHNEMSWLLTKIWDQRFPKASSWRKFVYTQIFDNLTLLGTVGLKMIYHLFWLNSTSCCANIVRVNARCHNVFCALYVKQLLDRRKLQTKRKTLDLENWSCLRYN